MSDAIAAWVPQHAWDGILVPGHYGVSRGEPGFRVAPREGLSLTTIIGRADRAAVLDHALAHHLGIEPSRGPRVARGRGAELIWAGPHRWLLAGESPELARQLTKALAGMAALSDQSDARAILRVSGPRARDVLAKGCLVDLHPRAFKIGDVALTPIAHVGVHLWQVDDAPTYDLSVFRSMAASFWSWLRASAAEYGLEVMLGEQPA